MFPLPPVPRFWSVFWSVKVKPKKHLHAQRQWRGVERSLARISLRCIRGRGQGWCVSRGIERNAKQRTLRNVTRTRPGGRSSERLDKDTWTGGQQLKWRKGRTSVEGSTVLCDVKHTGKWRVEVSSCQKYLIRIMK